MLSYALFTQQIRTYSSVFNSTSAKIIKEVLDIPQKPVGAYALFIKDQFRSRDKDQQAHDYLKACAIKWRNLSQSQRSVYENRSTKERERYLKAKTEFLDRLSINGRQLYGLLNFDSMCKRGLSTLRALPKSDMAWLKAMPKQPTATAHSLFMSHFMKGKKPDLKAAQNAWKNLSNKEKTELEAECKTDVERYVNQVKELVDKA